MIKAIVGTVLRRRARQQRRDLQKSSTSDMQRRRAIIAVSIGGIAVMTPVTLLQTGIVRHLPDPPVRGFHSDKVNSSDQAYLFGVPDGAVSIASFAANIPLAALGRDGRARRHPLIPIAAAAKAGVEVAIAGWYLYQMPAKEKAWCAYCIMAASASVGVFALTLPEARRALGELVG